MILDLRQHIQDYLTVTLPSADEKGIEVKLNKPSERVNVLLAATINEQITLAAKDARGEEISMEEQLAFIDMLQDLVYEMLNNNREGLKFDWAYVKGYFGEAEMMNALIIAYNQFKDKVMSDPN